MLLELHLDAVDGQVWKDLFHPGHLIRLALLNLHFHVIQRHPGSLLDFSPGFFRIIQLSVFPVHAIPLQSQCNFANVSWLEDLIGTSVLQKYILYTIYIYCMAQAISAKLNSRHNLETLLLSEQS